MLDLNLIKNSQVLLRVNYDLSTLLDTDRIKDSLQTIQLLLKNQNQIILITHWGRPKGQIVEQFSTKNLLAAIGQVFQQENEIVLANTNIEFLNQFESFTDTASFIKNYPKNLQNKTIFLLENTRFHPDEQSKNPDQRQNLATQYASLAQYFVDEAFPLSHRQEATNYEIKSILPSTFGLSYQSEIVHLDKIKKTPQPPFYIVMAGSKLETKLPLISGLIDKADKIFLGGMLCFTFIRASSQIYPDKKLPDIFDSIVEESFLDTAKFILNTYPGKIVLPLDFVFDIVNGKKLAMDIGPETITMYSRELSKASTIFWNGTMGYYEKPPFDQGTLQVAKNVSNFENAFKVIGGGDTNSSLPHDITGKFDFVSMGGGATLDFLSKKE